MTTIIELLQVFLPDVTPVWERSNAGSQFELISWQTPRASSHRSETVLNQVFLQKPRPDKRSVGRTHRRFSITEINRLIVCV